MWPNTNADNNVHIFNADGIDGETPPPPTTNDGTTGSGNGNGIGNGGNTGNRGNTEGGVRDIQRSRGLVGGFIGGVSNGLSTIKDYLNPLNYYTTSAVREGYFKSFMILQNNYNTANRNYYPFTEVNPYAS